MVPPTLERLSGQNAGKKNSIAESFRFYSPRSGARYIVLRRPAAASTISKPTENACATRSSTPKACALPQAWWRPDARWPLAHASNVPECIGLCAAPTPSSLSAVPSSVLAFRTSGSADQNAGPHDPPLSSGAPYGIPLGGRESAQKSAPV